ncbi:hypothetical protein [Tsukamurella sp. NPDC003166]|uniref:hypothetical protein n=1 Tax=Tsukamurella sp. NPDC003166 TaxID=3154444 RepID=UPI0033BCEF16
MSLANGNGPATPPTGNRRQLVVALAIAAVAILVAVIAIVAVSVGSDDSSGPAAGPAAAASTPAAAAVAAGSRETNLVAPVVSLFPTAARIAEATGIDYAGITPIDLSGTGASNSTAWSAVPERCNDASTSSQAIWAGAQQRIVVQSGQTAANTSTNLLGITIGTFADSTTAASVYQSVRDAVVSCGPEFRIGPPERRWTMYHQELWPGRTARVTWTQGAESAYRTKLLSAAAVYGNAVVLAYTSRDYTRSVPDDAMDRIVNAVLANAAR